MPGKALTLITAIVFVIFSLVSCGNIRLNDVKPIDNSYRNYVENISKADFRIAMTDGSVFIRKFETIFGITKTAKEQRVYEIADNSSAREILFDPDSTYMEFHEMYTYNNSILDCCLYKNEKTGKTELRRLDPEKGRYESYIELSPPDKSDIYRFTVHENELYIFTKKNNVYKYDNGKYSPIFSNKKNDVDYFITDFYKHYMYYTESWDSLEQLEPFYKYDLRKDKTVAKYDISCLKQLYKKHLKAYYTVFLDNYLYLELTHPEKSSKNYIYRIDLKTNNLTKLCETKGDVVLNGYGEDAYIGLQGKDAGLYRCTDESEELTKLSDREIDTVYILDNKWVYYSDTAGTLYRITKDGVAEEKVLNMNEPTFRLPF